MTTSCTYARFDCRTCGETVYSPVSLDKQEVSFSKNKTLELSCSSGHTDQYSIQEVVLVPNRPEGRLRMRHAFAVGG
jgi:hypothetical protein